MGAPIAVTSRARALAPLGRGTADARPRPGPDRLLQGGITRRSERTYNHLLEKEIQQEIQIHLSPGLGEEVDAVSLR